LCENKKQKKAEKFTVEVFRNLNALCNLIKLYKFYLKATVLKTLVKTNVVNKIQLITIISVNNYLNKIK